MDINEVEEAYFKNHKTVFEIGELVKIKDTSMVTDLARNKCVFITKKTFSFAIEDSEPVIYWFYVNGIQGTLPSKYLEKVD